MASGRFEIVVPERRDALRTASRHTARVRFLQRFIIIGVTLTTACIAIIALFDPFKHLPISVSVSSVKLDGTRVTTMDPKLTGFRKDGRTYEVVAKSGIQDLLDTNIVELRGVKAKIILDDNSMARVQADVGIHDSRNDTIKLRDNVHIINAVGYEFILKSMLMDLKTGDMSSDEQTTLLLNGAKFDSDRMSITENGHKMTFEGSVKSVIDQDSDDSSVGALTKAEQ